MSTHTKQSLKYLINRYVLRKPFLTGKEHKFGSLLRFKTEDVVGRRIYKNGSYETDLSDYISNNLAFESNDIALDIGANIGWYSMLLNKVMPASAQIFAFEPDPLNYELLATNIDLNNAKNIKAINNALSDKQETKKLYRYSNKNLGRHSLLDINKGEAIEIETIVLDQFLEHNNINLQNVKFAKIDIEGYEFFALSGALKVLDHIKCLISEFVPAHMLKGGVDPMRLISLLENKGFTPHIIRARMLQPVTSAELLAGSACDIIWKKSS